jgi:hypothetical protein
MKVASLLRHSNNLSQEVRVKVEFTQQSAMKAQRGNRGISLLFGASCGGWLKPHPGNGPVLIV